MSQRPGLASSTTRVLLAESLIVPSGLLTAAYLGRSLGPELYGLFSVATAVSVTLEWVISSVFGRSTVKLLSEATDWRPIASTILMVHLVLGLTLAAAFWIGADWLAHRLGDPRLAPWLALLALEVPVATTAAACRNIMTGRGQLKGRALSTGVRWVLRPIAIVAFVEAGWSVTGAVLGSLSAATCGWLVAMTMARVPLMTTTRVPLARLWRLALPMFVLAISLRVIDKLGLFAVQALGPSPLDAGWYAAALNFAIAPGLFAVSFSPLLLAEVTWVRARGTLAAAHLLVGQALRTVVALLPPVAILAGSAPEIVRLIYGDGFDGAAPLSWPLLLAAYAMLLTSVATSVLIASDRAALAALCVWPLVPVTAVAMAVVVPRAGGHGAAVVTAVAVWISAGASLTLVGTTLHAWPPVATGVRSVGIALTLGAVAAWWPAPGLWVVGKVALLCAVTPLLFAGTGEFAARAVAGAPSSGGEGHDSGSYWDAVATEWDDDASPDDWRSHSDAVNLAACLRWWPSRPVGRVLKTDLFDEVAGEGLVTALAARASSVVGIDRSLEAARASRRRAGAGAVGADVRHLPFADGAFDLIVSNSTLDHFQDAREIGRAIAELHRVLAPGGRVILTLDNPHNPVVWLRNALPFRALHHVGLVPYYVGATLSAADARIMLAEAGLTVTASTALMHCPRALAIATLHATRWLASPRLSRRIGSGLMAFERMERWPLRYRTGYFLALVADKEPA
jgi:O-antigen/teichoic acid export membrane protein/SAM-dependent methyltransferase